MNGPTRQSLSSIQELKDVLKDGEESLHLFTMQGFTANEFIQQSAPEFRIRPSHEGLYSPVDSAGAPGDFSRTANDFDFHTDGLYEHQLPQWVLLHCIHPGELRAVTVLADSAAAVDSLTPANRRVTEMLSTVYIGRDGSEFSRPLLTSATAGARSTMQLVSRGYLRPTRLRPDLGDHLTVRDIAQVTADIFDALESSIRLVHDWQTDDVLVFDNHRYPHARRAQGRGIDSGRRLDRVWFDFE